METSYLADGVRLAGFDLPSDWGHYLVGPASFSIIGPYGQGYSIDRVPEVFQFVGPRRYLYVFDPETGEGFSPTWVPMMRGLESYEVIQQPWQCDFRAVATIGARTSVRVCVDPATGAEAWRLELSSSRARRLRVAMLYPFLERRGFGARCEFDAASNAIISHVTPFFVTDDEHQRLSELKQVACLVLDRKPDAFACETAKVLPIDEAAGHPAFLGGAMPAGTPALGGKSCAFALFDLHLKAGESQVLRWALGAGFGPEQARAISPALQDGGSFARAAEAWKEWDSPLRVELPDEGLTRFVNTFAKHQSRMNCVTARWSQSPASRNWAQDWMGSALLRPQDSLGALKSLLAAQRCDGFVPQGFTMSSRAKLVDALGKDFRDGPVWPPLHAQAVLEATGDGAWLSDVVPFANGGSATVLEHLRLGLEFLWRRVGPHGLPLFGEGDWNDQINNAGPKGKGESTFLAMAFIHACRVTAEICRTWAGQPRVADELEAWASEMQQRTNAVAWDGAWYNRGFLDDGTPFGTRAQDEGTMFLEPQAWGLLARAVPADRLPVLLASIKDKLLGPTGPKLLTPAFRRWHPELGRISVDLPGKKENGSAYCHATMFYAAGLLAQGMSEEAVSQLTAVLPCNPRNPSPANGQHPGYIPNHYNSDEAGPEHAGKGSNHQWTGTAPWLLRLVVREVLGVRGVPGGVRVEPQLPPAWQAASLDITFQGATLRIRIARGPRPGVVLGGKPLPDGFIPLTPGCTRDIAVTV